VNYRIKISLALDNDILWIKVFITSCDNHFYDEEDIDVGNPMTCKVVVNHTIVLTEEEKAEARRKAIQKAQDEAYAKMKQGKSKPKTRQPQVSDEPSLFNF
jgi:hypothetical protein